jgi:hypothetical protein
MQNADHNTYVTGLLRIKCDCLKQIPKEEIKRITVPSQPGAGWGEVRNFQ